MEVEPQNVKFLFQTITISLLIIIFISAVYYMYLQRGRFWGVLAQLSIVIPILILLFLIFYVQIISNLILSGIFCFVLITILLFFVRSYREFECEKPEEKLGEIENISIFHLPREKRQNLQCIL